MRQTTIFDDTVANRFNALLARCDRIRRGTEIDRPIKFDIAGERYATAIAQNDRPVSRLDDDLEAREVGDSLQRADTARITTTQNAMPIHPIDTASHKLTRRSAIDDNS